MKCNEAKNRDRYECDQRLLKLEDYLSMLWKTAGFVHAALKWDSKCSLITRELHFLLLVVILFWIPLSDGAAA